MGRACTVCTHPEADAINAGLEAGQTLRALAAEYGLSDSALDRHARRHLFAQAVTAAAATPAHNESRTPSHTPAEPGAPRAKRSVPKWLWAFAAGYAVCWLRQHAGIGSSE